MPRAESKALSSQLYSSQYGSSQYSSDSPASQQSERQQSQQQSSPTSSSSPLQTAAKKKHLCPTCDRAFTTSGHLARHSRVHTGERNHKCPFPGCETRCSRQDNLQQQYVYPFYVSKLVNNTFISATESIFRLDLGGALRGLL